MGGFAHDTGEGGVSPYHRENGGDIIWEIGSGYFGCRDTDGNFSPENFVKTATLPQVKMIEIKLSQGAKPGHGGVLPAAKITEEVSAIRGVPMGRDCVSPAAHPAFSTPLELMAFIKQLRELSGGKPVGFKLCIGQKHEFLAIVKAMLKTGVTPDFIVVDGKEGGTGAAPSEFIDHMGMPLREGLTFVHFALVGAGLRDKIKIGASGMMISAFDIARTMALGADWVNMARAFMFAVGCIQSQTCHTDTCPTGVATQDPDRQRALVVPDKAQRVKQFHEKTLMALAEVVGGAGLDASKGIPPLPFSQAHGRVRSHVLHGPLPAAEERGAAGRDGRPAVQAGLGAGAGRDVCGGAWSRLVYMSRFEHELVSAFGNRLRGSVRHETICHHHRPAARLSGSSPRTGH